DVVAAGCADPGEVIRALLGWPAISCARSRSMEIQCGLEVQLEDAILGPGLREAAGSDIFVSPLHVPDGFAAVLILAREAARDAGFVCRPFDSTLAAGSREAVP